MGGESDRTLPGDGPLVLGRCNCDTLSPKRCSNVDVMDLWSSELVIVFVKLSACEDAVTYLRVKLQVSAREGGVEGQAM